MWDLVADKFSDDSMTVAQVDCSLHANHLICLQFHVRAYPTILLLRDDQYFKFRGKRSMKAFLEFVDEEGYLLSDDHGPLPEMLPGQLISKHKEKQEKMRQERETISFLRQMFTDFEFAVNRVFDKFFGKGSVPRFIRLAIPIVFVTTPIWLLCFLVCIGELEQETEKMVERAKRLEKKEKAQRRREAETRLYMNRQKLRGNTIGPSSNKQLKLD